MSNTTGAHDPLVGEDADSSPADGGARTCDSPLPAGCTLRPAQPPGQPGQDQRADASNYSAHRQRDGQHAVQKVAVA